MAGPEAEDSCVLADVAESFTFDAMDYDTCSTQCARSTEKDPLNRCRFWRYVSLSSYFIFSFKDTFQSESKPLFFLKIFC